MANEGVLLIAELHGRTGTLPALRDVLGELAEGARAEPECTGFRVLAAGEPGELVLLAEWSSEAALREHYDTPHYRRYRGLVGELLARPSDVIVHHLSGTVHAVDPNPPEPGLLG